MSNYTYNNFKTVFYIALVILFRYNVYITRDIYSCL